MKDAYFFSHDSNTRSDTKIMSLLSVYDFKGYGWFWAIIETLRDSTDYKLPLNSKYCFKNYASLLRCSEVEAKEFIDDCINEFQLFESDGESFWSESLLRRMNKVNEKRLINSQNAKKGGRPAKQKQNEFSTEKTNNDYEFSNEKTKQDKEVIEQVEKKEVVFDSEVVNLVNLFCDKLRENNDKAKIPSDLKKWSGSIDALNRLDGYSFDDIEKVLVWSQQNNFWKTNILSATKLREKFGQLLLSMQEEERKMIDNAKYTGHGKGFTRTDSKDKKPRYNIPEASDLGGFTLEDALKRVYGSEAIPMQQVQG